VTLEPVRVMEAGVVQKLSVEEVYLDHLGDACVLQNLLSVLSIAYYSG